MSNRIRIYMTGVGGQGTLTATTLLARVAVAQAANDLLTIQGVDASFVAVQVGTGVNVSARSLGAVNVQVIMESLGGGGHQTMAAAQLKHITPEAARSRIEGAIDKYYASQKKGGAEGK